MKVLVLGCGPAGLMAAHAAALMGHEIAILSKARKSHMKGAQFLHGPIPLPGWVTDEPFEVDYQLRGTADGYRQKVYHDIPVFRADKLKLKVSPEELAGKHQAWDIRVAYNWLWDKYGLLVKDADLYPTVIDEALDWVKADIVISTIPAKLLCLEGHTFASQRIWSSDQQMEALPDNTVVCNGESVPRWYRAAKIQGWNTVEWPYEVKPPLPQHQLWDVEKPLFTNCSCFPDIVRMGRYGKWQKGVLSHSAFYETVKLVSGPLQEAMF